MCLSPDDWSTVRIMVTGGRKRHLDPYTVKSGECKKPLTVWTQSVLDQNPGGGESEDGSVACGVTDTTLM